MLKKVMLLASAIALVAFAVPALASAHQLTNSEAETIEPETTITGVSHNTVTTIPTTPPRDLTCATVTIHGIVTVNNGSTVRVSMDGANDTAEECHIVVTNPPGTVVATIPANVSPTFEELHLGTESETENTAKFTFSTSFNAGEGEVTCPASSGASLVTPLGGNNVAINAAVIPGAEGCPGGELHGSFALTFAGGVVNVD